MESWFFRTIGFLMVYSCARRVQQNVVFSESHGVTHSAAFIPGPSVFGGLKRPATAMAAHHPPQMTMTVPNVPGVRQAFLRNHIAPGGTGHRVSTRTLTRDGENPDVSQLEHLRIEDQAAKQSVKADRSWIADEQYPEFLRPTRNPMRVQLKVRTVLKLWTKDAMLIGNRLKKRGQSKENRGDRKAEILMSQKLASIKSIQAQIEYKITEHVLGLAVPFKASQDNLQALASVFLESWTDDSGQLNGEQGASVPVVCITALVSAPRKIARANTVKGSTSQEWAADELVHGIVAWAQEMGRLVTVAPADTEDENHYRSLGFEYIDADPRVFMVYRGNQDFDRPLRGLFLRFSLETRIDPNEIAVSGWDF